MDIKLKNIFFVSSNFSCEFIDIFSLFNTNFKTKKHLFDLEKALGKIHKKNLYLINNFLLKVPLRSLLGQNSHRKDSKKPWKEFLLFEGTTFAVKIS